MEEEQKNGRPPIDFLEMNNSAQGNSAASDDSYGSNGLEDENRLVTACSGNQKPATSGVGVAASTLVIEQNFLFNQNNYQMQTNPIFMHDNIHSVAAFPQMPLPLQYPSLPQDNASEQLEEERQEQGKQKKRKHNPDERALVLKNVKYPRLFGDSSQAQVQLSDMVQPVDAQTDSMAVWVKQNMDMEFGTPDIGQDSAGVDASESESKLQQRYDMFVQFLREMFPGENDEALKARVQSNKADIAQKFCKSDHYRKLFVS